MLKSEIIIIMKAMLYLILLSFELNVKNIAEKERGTIKDIKETIALDFV